ncbi:metalloregulator ArsR/SmtB family transcription factor [Pseudomonas citronellolis]|uniref:metalloregulator ArsR/SmtB family transcription factor n=1 Tax=Pseudomonas citronellolis TaxID=53408 RepID=UPI0021BF30A8|nr:metalloregulator ArsR/SmtB family transcription factor [Pseudomonas citronellolis]UXJ50242.1 metalloregulator ArsR/SmtB family transcription factor [Pseudomonas citronellolis]
MSHLNAVAVISALADPTRRSLFESLVQVPQVVSDLATSVPVSRSAVSQHLRCLKDAGLVTERKIGRLVRYEARADALKEAARYLQTMAETVLGPTEGAGYEWHTPPATEPMGDDAIDTAMAHWAAGSLKFDPTAVATIARLRLVNGLLEERYGEIADRFGLNTGEAMALGTLRRLDSSTGITPGELARASVVAPPSLAKHLRVLERSGLIRREENPADQRSHRVRLTRKGRDVADTIVEEQLGRHYAALFALPETERSVMDRILRLLLRDLGQHTKSGRLR